VKLRFGSPGECGNERETLSHTWLERRLLDELKMDCEDWLNAAPNSPIPEVLAGIPLQIVKLTRFVDRMVEDFSPGHLVDQCPLAQLEGSTKQLLREALHTAYVASGVILPYQAALRLATEEFSKTAAKAETVWRTGDRERKAEFLSELEAKALALREALALPQGVILP